MYVVLKCFIPSAFRYVYNAWIAVRFFQDAEDEIKAMEKGMKTIADLSRKLASHYCENETSFKVEELIETLKTFCCKIQQCQKVVIKSYWYLNPNLIKK